MLPQRSSSFLHAPRSVVQRPARKTGSGGITLFEILLGVLLIVGGGGALLLAISSVMTHSEYVGQMQIAVNAAQGRLEELASTDFDTLWDPNAPGGHALDAARTTRLLETLLNPVLPNGQPALPNGRLAIQVRSAVPSGAAPGDQNTILLDLHVAACWVHKGRTIGEGGTNCQDGPDANWWVDSPVMVSTRVARRE